MSERPKPISRQEDQKPISEAIKGQEGTLDQAQGGETGGETVSVLSPENQNFFSRMSESGKKIAHRVYQGLDKIPGVNRIVGRMEIAYNQFWIDRHQKKAVGFKSKMDGLDLRINALDQAKEEINSSIRNWKQQNISGVVESLELKLQDIERRKNGLLTKKDRAQTQLEARDNKIKLYTNGRDRVADRFINRYEEKLRPMEAELKRLQTHRDEADLLIAVAKARHKEKLAELDDREKEKNQLEEILQRAGMSKKDKAIIRQLERAIADSRERIRIERENLTGRKAGIDEKIARVDERANPYRDKREEFIRVKKGRPIKIGVAVRQRDEGFSDEEKVLAHSRSGAARETDSISIEVGREIWAGGERAEDKERLQAAAYISGLNAFLTKVYGNTAKLIDAKDFLRATRLSENNRLDFKDFKDILDKYLKYRKISMNQFNQSIDKFFEQLKQKAKVKK